MRHIWLIPKDSWYMAPMRLVEPGKPDIQSQITLSSDQGDTKYEFWLEREDEEFYHLIREYNDGSKVFVEVFKHKFDIEDYYEVEETV